MTLKKNRKQKNRNKIDQIFFSLFSLPIEVNHHLLLNSVSGGHILCSGERFDVQSSVQVEFNSVFTTVSYGNFMQKENPGYPSSNM